MEPALKSHFPNITEEEKEEYFCENTPNLKSAETAPHKFFLYVLGCLQDGEKKKWKELNYESPHSEEIFNKISFILADPSTCADQIYRDTSLEYVQNDCSKSDFLRTTRKLLEDQYPNKKKKIEILAKYFQESIEKKPQKIEYFTQKGLSSDDAYCCALALSYYTGMNGEECKTSNDTNRRTSAVLRFGLKDHGILNDFKNIYYFLMKALSFIPYYWGKCIRAVNLEKDEISKYEVGSVVSWVQFSSSTSASEPPPYFQKRNTYFYLYSLTGRSIKKFSNFDKEDEILFPPYSSFLVCKKELKQGQTRIFLRQIDLGMNKNSMLWVDDQIFNSDWENKTLMEKFTSENFQKNLHIIPKISTKTAISFLESPIGQYFKLKNPKFQVISDMSRPDEENGSEAGAIFTKKFRGMGFPHSVMIYTSDKNAALNKLGKNGVVDLKNVFVTHSQLEAINYIKRKV